MCLLGSATTVKYENMKRARTAGLLVLSVSRDVEGKDNQAKFVVYVRQSHNIS